jgi:hypothetical protein
MNLPLHGGKAPRCLFTRMKNLSREIISLIVSEYSAAEMLERGFQTHYGFRLLDAF